MAACLLIFPVIGSAFPIFSSAAPTVRTVLPAYHPVEVKWHKIIERSRPPDSDAEEPRVLRYSTLESPGPGSAIEASGYGLRIGSRVADFLQLAHYHRMLEACGFGAEDAFAGVIGTDDLFGAPVLAWADLRAPQVRTFSRSSPRGLAAPQPARALRP